MAQVTAEMIQKQIAEVRDIMQNEMKTLQERLTEAEALAKKTADDVKLYRRENVVTPGVPMDDVQGKVVTQKGGIFNGKFQLPYQKMISLSPHNPALLSGDSERLKTIQDLNDAVVVRYYHESKSAGPRASHTDILDKISKSMDFQLLAAQMVNAGYIKAANDLLNPAGGTGVNLDFTLLSAQMIDLVRISAIVGAQFPTVPLTRAKQEFPALRADTKSVLGGGLGLPQDDLSSIGATPPANMVQRPTLGQVAFDCIHNLGAIGWTDDMLEDSVVPFLPMMREQGAIMIARGRDAAIINGDDTGTHMDSDVSAAYDIRKAWDGLRKLGENNEYTATAPVAASHFNQLMRKLGKWATNPTSLVMFLNITDWLILAADTDLTTVEKIGGDRATLRQGVINTVSGVNIVVTEEIRRDLNASGVYDGVTTNNTIEILCNPSRFWNGVRHDARVEEVRMPQALATWLQVDVREDFQAIDKNDTDNVFPAGDAPVAIAVDVTA